jgi:type 1 glutamine amidotransferase
MKRVRGILGTWLLLSCCAVFGAEKKINVLLVTGGHGFETNQFFRVFEENPEITFTKVTQVKTSTAYDRDDLLSYDCIVLYDMVQNITAAQKAKFLSLLDKGVGLVVTHHALVSYQSWPEFERIIGGTYPEPQDKRGKVTPELGYQHDVDVPVVIVAKDHPITAGLKDFTINDEIYWGFRTTPDAKPLITTTQAKSGKPLAWYRTEKNSRVVYLQLGHGPSAYNDPNYRKLLAQSIRWTAKQ